jgi:hypothetical protein
VRAAHPQAVRAVHAAAVCQSRVALLAAWQDRASAWLAAATDLLILRAQVVALAPEDAGHQGDFRTTRDQVLKSLAEGDSSHAVAAVRRLQSAASTLDSTLPVAASTLRALGASVAMDILAAPELAWPLTSALARVSPDDPAISCNHAEVALALWEDGKGVQSAIAQCIQRADTPALRVVGHAFALAFATLRGDSAAAAKEGTHLTAALNATGAQPIEWSFNGLKVVLRRGDTSKSWLIPVFDALELPDPRQRRERLAVAIKATCTGC